MGNAIHPTAVLGPEVDLGSGTTIGPGVVLLGPLRIADDNGQGPPSSRRAAWGWWRSRVRG